jgi:hypothetical protein
MRFTNRLAKTGRVDNICWPSRDGNGGRSTLENPFDDTALVLYPVDNNPPVLREEKKK